MYSRRVCLLSVVTATVLMFTACATAPPPSGPTVAGQYACGQLEIRVADIEGSDLLGIDYQGKRLLLKPETSASGARYVAPGDDSTRFWSKGERATLSIQGQTYPECLQPGALAMPFEARGNEPFWHATIEGDELFLTRPYEEKGTRRLAVEVVTANRHGREFRAEQDGGVITLTVARQLCEDSMSGIQYPAQARLTVGGETFNGCGGNPERLFRGAEWVVEDLAGSGIIDRSRITIEFLDNQRVAGRASCNRYSGHYRFSGESLTLDQLATTRMACAPALMQQEARFLDLLSRVRRAAIGRRGELILSTPDGSRITAVQSTSVSP